MEPFAAAKPLLALCQSGSNASKSLEQAAQLQAAAVALSLGQDQHRSADASQLFQTCIKAATGCLSSSDPQAQLGAMAALVTALQHCRGDVFLERAADVAQRLQAVVRAPHAPLQPACRCFRVILQRVAPLLTSAVKPQAAVVAAKVAAAAMQLLQSAGGAKHAFELIVAIAGCMPQVLRTHTMTATHACLDAVVLPAGDINLDARLSAAQAVARLAACSGSSEACGISIHGLVYFTHATLAALPMPHKDEQLLQAALDVLGAAPATPWSTVRQPAASWPLCDAMCASTALLHAVSCALSERVPMAAPLPASALVLLSSRLLSVRPAVAAASMASETDPLRACQWQACAAPLLNAGVPRLASCCQVDLLVQRLYGCITHICFVKTSECVQVCVCLDCCSRGQVCCCPLQARCAASCAACWKTLRRQARCSPRRARSCTVSCTVPCTCWVPLQQSSWRNLC